LKNNLPNLYKINLYLLLYMTTKSIMKKLLTEGKLKRFEPYLREKEIHKREIFMTKTLWEHIINKVPDMYGEEYQIKLERRLATFIKGNKINDFRDIKELEPFGSGVWEFKIIEEPHSRIFGAFLESDIFIAFYMEKRSSLKGRFEPFIKRTKNQWKILFGGKKMLLSSNIDNLISNGVCYDPRKK